MFGFIDFNYVDIDFNDRILFAVFELIVYLCIKQYGKRHTLKLETMSQATVNIVNFENTLHVVAIKDGVAIKTSKFYFEMDEDFENHKIIDEKKDFLSDFGYEITNSDEKELDQFVIYPISFELCKRIVSEFKNSLHECCEAFIIPERAIGWGERSRTLPAIKTIAHYNNTRRKMIQ